MPGSARVPRAAMVGDPFLGVALQALGSLAKPLLKKGVSALGRKVLHRGGSPPPASSLVGVSAAGQFGPVANVGGTLVARAGAAMGARFGGGRTTGFVSGTARSLPAGSRIESFPAGVGAYRRRYRRMNMLNLRALKRAIRRAKGFEHIARQVLTIPHHFKRHIHARGRKR
jgi:hypothetical protein